MPADVEQGLQGKRQGLGEQGDAGGAGRENGVGLQRGDGQHVAAVLFVIDLQAGLALEGEHYLVGIVGMDTGVARRAEQQAVIIGQPEPTSPGAVPCFAHCRFPIRFGARSLRRVAIVQRPIMLEVTCRDSRPMPRRASRSLQCRWAWVRALAT
ncbi:hypothetical protein EMIT047CA2_120092 [Pseudomonas soli]